MCTLLSSQQRGQGTYELRISSLPSPQTVMSPTVCLSFLLLTVCVMLPEVVLQMLRLGVEFYHSPLRDTYSSSGRWKQSTRCPADLPADGPAKRYSPLFAYIGRTRAVCLLIASHQVMTICHLLCWAVTMWMAQVATASEEFIVWSIRQNSQMISLWWNTIQVKESKSSVSSSRSSSARSLHRKPSFILLFCLRQQLVGSLIFFSKTV